MTITLWTIFEILINFYQGGLETWFIYKFLTPRSHERAKIWAVIFAVCEGCLVTAFNYFTVFEGFGSALYWASLLVFAFCFFSDNAVKKFLSISLSQVAILLITSLELNAVSSFFKISLRKLVVEQSLLRFVTLIMIQISIFIVFRLILMAFKHTDDYTASDWVTIIAVLIISFFLVMVIHELSLSADYGHRLYINLSYMLVFVLNILIFWIINSLIKKNRKLKEMEIVKLREQYLEQFIGNAESQYDAMRKLRHDIKDKYETVNELLKVQKIDETRKFISESFDLIGKSESYVKTKNNIVNAIVNAKLTMASSLGIKISCITVSDFEGIKGTDLCDLLSNTLENAITACKEIADDANKFLYLKIDRETDTYTFLIKNSIDHSVMDSNPRLTTTKADKKQHGLGTSIIREIDGSVIISFLTNYAEFAVKGYDVGAFRYILKNQPDYVYTKQLNSIIAECQQRFRTFTFNNKNLSFKFRLTDILYFEGHRRKVSLFTVNGELEYGGDFSTVCGELLKYNFAIINRGILVNLDHIQNITKYDIILSNGRKIPIGKTYKDEIVARYLNYATGR